MTISQTPITGAIPKPDGTMPTGGIAIFELSDQDTEGDAVIPKAKVTATLTADSELPADFTLWPNGAGIRGTNYSVSMSCLEALPSGTPIRKTYPMGRIQLGDEPTYSIGELLALPVDEAPGWYFVSPADGTLPTSALDLSGLAGALLKVTQEGDDVEAAELVFEEATLDADTADETLVYSDQGLIADNMPDATPGWVIFAGKAVGGSTEGNVAHLAINTVTGDRATRARNAGVWSNWSIF